MKTIKTLGGVLILLAILLSACAPAASSDAPANVGGGKAVSDVIFTGVIESMNGDQWIINGQPVKVDQSALRDGPFQVGDTVKVEAAVAEDGSVTAQRVETPSLADLAETSTPEATEAPTEAPGTSSTPQPLTFDDSGNEAVGTVEAITDTSITIGGQTFPLAAGAEIKGEIVAGSLVKLHFMTNADGTLSVTEIEVTDATQLDNSNSNSNDDNSNANSNDDNGNDDNSNDDDSNDDHGGNSNDDSNGNDNGSDDNGGGNSNGNG